MRSAGRIRLANIVSNKATGCGTESRTRLVDAPIAILARPWLAGRCCKLRLSSFAIARRRIHICVSRKLVIRSRAS
jgi:hypothetical protein